MPEIAETAPKTALRGRYRDRFPLIVRAAAAGVTTKKPTSNVPVTWIPIATVTETRSRYSRFTRAVLIPLDLASSSEIKLKTIFLYM
jgi:hypothetical protein